MGNWGKRWIPVIAVAILSIAIVSISAEESLIPAWIKNTAGFWVNGDVTDKEFISAMEWMLENDVIQVIESESSERIESLQNQLDLYKSAYDKLEKENEMLKAELGIFGTQTTSLIQSTYLKLNADEFVLPTSRGTSKIVQINGYVDNYFRGTNVYLIVEKPGSEPETLKLVAVDGAYTAQIILNHDSPKGEYVLRTEYQGIEVDAISFIVTDQYSQKESVGEATKTSAQVPSWIKNTVSFWVQGGVSDKEFISAMGWMIENDVIKVSESSDRIKALEDQLGLYKSYYDKLEKENELLRAEVEQSLLVGQAGIGNSEYGGESYSPPPPEPEVDYSQYCYGYAECFVGTVTEVIDGDTIKVDGESIRFALVDTPEYGEAGYTQARKYIEQVCPVGSAVLVDEDDYQTQGSYGRMIALIYCQKDSSSEVINLNEQILDSGLAEISTYYCSKSEFEFTSWAQRHGCETYYEEPAPKYTPPTSSQTTQPSCDPSYPTVCIPTYPPDLDCEEISYTNFEVLQPDPHGLDGDMDGIGCETQSTTKSESPKYEPPKSEPPESAPETTQESCDPSYPTVCIPPPPPDLDCGEISYRNFQVSGSDPHGFDRDNDGIGCES